MYVCRLQNGHRPQRIKEVSGFKEGPEEQDKGLTHMHEAPRSLGKREDIGELLGRVGGQRHIELCCHVSQAVEA